MKPIPKFTSADPDGSEPTLASKPPLAVIEDSSVMEPDVADKGTPEPSPPPPRILCVRHQRMADEGTNLKLQQSLDALPVEERESVNAIWSNFSSSSHPRRTLILQGLLTMCCFSQLSLLSEQLSHLIRIDPFAVLPRELALRILGNLDATSLCRAAQVSRLWNMLADDDVLWRGICEQHIGQKCRKCGWGLPRLDNRRRRPRSSRPNVTSRNGGLLLLRPAKRGLDNDGSDGTSSPEPSERCAKRSRSVTAPSSPSGADVEMGDHGSPSIPQEGTIDPGFPDPSSLFSTPYVTRPWKDVYSERLTIERNWRSGRCTVRTLKGHTDGIMCLQFSENLSHPSFPVLITGSYDRTVRVWNMETGASLLCLKGHTRAVRALQFDECKLITGSMDRSIRVWDWRTGKCVSTLMGHTEGVVCLNFDSNVLASGSVDTTVKVWNLRTTQAFTLRGHRDWVNSVQLWDSDSAAVTAAAAAVVNSPDAPQIDPGKMLFSASDDGMIRLWDLTLRTCVRQFIGHVGQVQSIKLLTLDEACGEDESQDCPSSTLTPGEPVSRADDPLLSMPGLEQPPSPSPSLSSTSIVPSACESSSSGSHTPSNSETPPPHRRRKTVLISGSLDNTIKMWDIDTGKTMRTLFGHIEGVWALAADKLRLVTGSHDRTIKVWNREDGNCTSTLVGHRGAVTCVALGEDKIISGSDDSTLKIWSFAG